MSNPPPPDEFEALRTLSQTLAPFSPEEQTRLLRWVSEKLGITAVPAPAAGTSTTPPAPPSGAAPGTAPSGSTNGGRVDIKSFVAAKQPKNDTQFAAVVAYFHRFEAEPKKDAISPDDLLTACRLASRDRPPAPAQTLRNAKNAGLLDNADHGTYTINSVGENLVAITLPGDGSATPVRRKRPAKKSPKPAVKKAAPQKAVLKSPAKKKAATKKK